MKDALSIIVLFFLVPILVLTGSAQIERPKKIDIKVGYVNSELFYDSKEGIPELVAIGSKIELVTKPQRDDLLEIDKKVKTFIDEWNECMKSMWCGEAKPNFMENKMKEGQALSDQFAIKARAYENEAKKLVESQLRPMETRIQDLLRKYAKENGYHLVVDISKQRNDGTQYSVINEANPDITKDFIQFCKNRLQESKGSELPKNK